MRKLDKNYNCRLEWELTLNENTPYPSKNFKLFIPKSVPMSDLAQNPSSNACTIQVYHFLDLWGSINNP